MTKPPPPSPVWLRPGERVLARMVANHIQGGRPMDGRLYLTSYRLMFVPDQAGVARGGRSAAIPWSDFAGADISERGSDDPGASVRRRLRVTKVSGQAELYVVWRPVKAVKMIDEARRSSEPSSN
jgi:GRAM domain